MHAPAGMMPADDNTNEDLPSFNVSYKPQKISPKFEGTVRQLLHKKIRDAYLHPQFTSDVMKPLTIEPLMDQEVQNLSGRCCWGRVVLLNLKAGRGCSNCRLVGQVCKCSAGAGC